MSLSLLPRSTLWYEIWTYYATWRLAGESVVCPTAKMWLVYFRCSAKAPATHAPPTMYVSHCVQNLRCKLMNLSCKAQDHSLCYDICHYYVMCWLAGWWHESVAGIFPCSNSLSSWIHDTCYILYFSSSWEWYQIVCAKWNRSIRRIQKQRLCAQPYTSEAAPVRLCHCQEEVVSLSFMNINWKAQNLILVHDKSPIMQHNHLCYSENRENAWFAV